MAVRVVTGAAEIVAEFNLASAKLIPEVTAVVSKGALNIKKDWQRLWKGHPYYKALPYAIGYDVYYTPGHILADIGPDKNRRQGALGNIIEFGTLKTPPNPGGLPALDAEAPKFEVALAAVVDKLLPP